MAKRTPVLFRFWQGDVIAIFPTEPGTLDAYTCNSYQHVGQHGACMPAGIIQDSRPATPAEYRALRRELEGAPYRYRLVVRARLLRSHILARRAALKAI